MTRPKSKKRASLLADVFGFEFGKAGGSDAPAAPASEGAEDTALPNPTDDTWIEERVRKADQATIRATAIDAALSAGVKRERASAFVKLVDFSGVPMHEDGPDEQALGVAVRRTLEQYPELRARTSSFGYAPGR